MTACEVFVLDVSSLAVSEGLLSRLSDDRRRKVLAFSHEAGRRLSLGAGLLLDFALSRHGLRERDAAYVYGRHGKPGLLPCGGEDGIHFNLSHSGTMAACALASCAVGVDIERTSRRVSEALIQRVCNAKEQELVHRDPLSFFDLWTAKEAVVKMTGEGISGDLAQIDLHGATTWRLPGDYAMSVCTAVPQPSVSVGLYRVEECGIVPDEGRRILRL